MKTAQDKISENITASIVSFALLLPNLVWVLLDKSVWKGDPVGYALNCIRLYELLLSNLRGWAGQLISGYKAPLLFWVGQFFVGFGNLIGSVNYALLLIPLTASFISLVLLFKSFELLYRNKWISVCGCLAVAASPLFNGEATGFWMEPMQIAITSWFIYALVKVKSWNFYFALSQFIIAGSLAMLVKVSSPMYVAGPAIAFWIIFFRGNPSMELSRKNSYSILISLFFLITTAIFYLHNFKDILGFAHYAATSPIFGMGVSKFDLWFQNLNNGIFLPFTFLAVALLVFGGLIKTIKLHAYDNFGVAFFVSWFQIVLFFVVWINSPNDDPRYFLPALPYFIILICWSLAILNNRLITAFSFFAFLFQFFSITSYTLGINQLDLHLPGVVQIVVREQKQEMKILKSLIPLASRDTAIIFDLNPELGVAEFQFELAKNNLTRNWLGSCIDVSALFNFNRQEIDTAKINVDTAWQNILRYKPDFYITWRNRLSVAQAAIEIEKIDKYNGATVKYRWAIAHKLKNCKLYEAVSLKSYPELLIYKRCDLPMEKFRKFN